ncbi:MAG: hypothetical protein RL410_155 [Actinomycetota bacterium]|jgi:ribosomal-protein-alanine N-acetyltransferase
MIQWPETQPDLSEDEITLRAFRPDDAEVMFAYVSGDPEIIEFTTVPDPYVIEDAHKAIERWTTGFADKDCMQYAITINGGQPIGHVTLFAVDLFDHHVEIGYLLSAGARGQGLMARCVELLSDYAFAIGFRRVHARTMIENIASAKTLLKAGFEQEAVLKNYMTKRNGEQTDALLFAKFADF